MKTQDFKTQDARSEFAGSFAIPLESNFKHNLISYLPDNI